MTKQKITAPEWFFNLKSTRKFVKYIFNLSPAENYFELLKQPYVGIVVHDVLRYAYIVEFTDATCKVFKDITKTELGEYLAIVYNNVENKLVYSSEKESSPTPPTPAPKP